MKPRYSVNANNQLVLKSPLIPEEPLEGTFSLEQDNQLVFLQNKLRRKISFEGKWQLDQDHNLEFFLNETRTQSKLDSLSIRGQIISVERDNLIFEVKTIDEQGRTHFKLLKLSGSWFADEYNRICFSVERKISPDVLIFKNSWQINKNQQIAYSYERAEQKRKTKTYNTLTFQGFWQIDSADKLTYILASSSKSVFDFRVQLESSNLYPKDNAIKYRIGIGLRQNRAQKEKIISLYGAWKFNRKLGLVFEVDYGTGKVSSIKFGANVYLTRNDEVTFSLLNSRNEPLGISVTFTHKFLKDLDARAFLRLKKSSREAGIEAGLRIPF